MLRLLWAIVVLGCCLAGEPARGQFAAERVASGLSTPVYVTSPPADSRLFIVEQGGEIRIHNGAGVLATPFLDLSAAIIFTGERGLLGLAFAPDYASSGSFYVKYTRAGDGAVEVARYSVSADPNVADPASAEVLLTIPHPNSSHNGGHIAFSPVDGFLYIALVDGGSTNDSDGNGQNPSTELGAMLRIDPSDGSAAPGNFLGTRVWSYGLRNPYRWSFDRDTGDLWIADVGQFAVEEVNLQPAASTGGENYGWNTMEGSACFNPPIGCSSAGLTLPTLEYGHGDFSNVRAVVGGYRYRGPAASLQGIYFFGDFGGHLFAASEDSPGVFSFQEITVTPDVGSIGAVSGFGEDADGNLYIVDIGGEVFRLLDPGPPVVPDQCPIAPRSGCAAAGRSNLLVKDKPPAGPSRLDRVVWRWLRGPATTQGDFGDPVTTADYALCLYAGGGSTLVMENEVAAGAGGNWSPIRDRGYKYIDASKSEDGIFRILLRGGDAGRSRVLLLGRDDNLTPPALPLGGGADVIVQMVNSDNANCWESRFPPSSFTRNTTLLFKAKTP